MALTAGRRMWLELRYGQDGADLLLAAEARAALARTTLNGTDIADTHIPTPTRHAEPEEWFRGGPYLLPDDLDP